VHKIPLFNAVTGAEHSVLFSQQQVITLKYGQCLTQFGYKSRSAASIVMSQTRIWKLTQTTLHLAMKFKTEQCFFLLKSVMCLSAGVAS
jgi:hypothetical protein